MKPQNAAGQALFPTGGLVAALLFFAMPDASLAAQPVKTGEQVYKETCFACHATGVDKAPKFGDKAAWGPLIKEGQHVLTAHGWVGVRGMPPKGGRADLALEEFARATAHMARAAGGDWKDPDAAMLGRIRAEEKKRVEQLKQKK
jgi:cytochrome c5